MGKPIVAVGEGFWRAILGIYSFLGGARARNVEGARSTAQRILLFLAARALGYVRKRASLLGGELVC
uniref:Uncharacterized protein n=1 Tax=Oryza meridionalis TaxID=40149 RepID=A0A0E0ED84_9ORYZ